MHSLVSISLVGISWSVVMQNNQLELSLAFCINGRLCHDTQGAVPCAFELGAHFFFPSEYLSMAVTDRGLKVFAENSY